MTDRMELSLRFFKRYQPMLEVCGRSRMLGDIGRASAPRTESLRTPLGCGKPHPIIGASLASTSSITLFATVSTFLPWRAPRSRDLGWSHRTMPVVLVPASASGTAKPAVRAKLPPLVIGRTTGTRVTRLKASGETIKTGRCPFCSCPVAGSRLTSQISPRFIGSTPYQINSLPAGFPLSHSRSSLVRAALGRHWARSSSRV
jgi:hypothetical protein